jgi:hypothetical protein
VGSFGQIRLAQTTAFPIHISDSHLQSRDAHPRPGRCMADFDKDGWLPADRDGSDISVLDKA